MKTTLTIGVGGGTGSGKTTLSQRLAQLLGPERVLILSQDNYYKPEGHLPWKRRAQLNFDQPEAVDFELLVSHLKQLQDGRRIARPRYDFKRHIQLAESEPVSPRPIVVVEGTLVFAQVELVRCFDLRLFVEADPDIRFIRRLERDRLERGRTVESIIQQYLQTVRPGHLRFVEPTREQADVVISGLEGFDHQLSVVLARIESATRIALGGSPGVDHQQSDSRGQSRS